MSKRVLLHLLGKAGYSPLICPLPSQREFNFDLFQKVLGGSRLRILHTGQAEAFWGPYRGRHLKLVECAIRSNKYNSSRVVLLDPDKGIHKSARTNKVLHVDEFKQLLRAAHRKVLAVYHHKNTGNLAYADVKELFPNTPSFHYDFGAAAVFFLCGPRARTLLSKTEKLVKLHFNQVRVAPE